MCSIDNFEAFLVKLLTFIGMEYHHFLIGKLFKNIDLSLGIELK